ncbi:hypothetical protein D187_008927 [Cystobacter fuscus DSM 2262]|uniref:Uncharacterized protein n=1 Tax=Cystobacter fuscus (strain ATCC 25194 / DSM 2262 / NBRC 100088 / M29) TaxID=1242864 RepID=S9QN85_CYSF2|nr:hypothetical protein [Cystobacter fuscus]EPX62739.1 hypothetical protein D187_008927 [Cystobacter fuscus DSM 2262]
MARRKPGSGSGSALAARLSRMIPILQKATDLFEEEVRERLGSGNTSLLTSIQQARDFYARAARASVHPVSKMEPGALAELHVTSWLDGKVVGSRVVHCFEGPLTGHDQFQRIVRQRLGEELPLTRLIPASHGKVGDRWSESAHSRDENHDRHDHEIKAIYSMKG